VATPLETPQKKEKIGKEEPKLGEGGKVKVLTENAATTGVMARKHWY
jgi:stress response protein YsnF